MKKSLQNRINANLKNARELHAQFVAGLQTRIAHDAEQVSIGEKDKPSPEWERALKWATVDSESTIRQIAALGKAFDFAHLCAILPNTKKGGTNFVATKVVEKCFKFVNAVFTQNAATATDYTVQVIYNALRNGGKLHIDDVHASLSRRCIGSDTATLSRANYTKGTAGSQGSQVRMLADVFKFAEVQKGKRDDVMILKPELIPELRDLFGVEDNAEPVPAE